MMEPSELADKLQQQRIRNNGKHPEGRILLGLTDAEWDSAIQALRAAPGAERKWCTYCRKDNHNDAECWSTRPDLRIGGKPYAGLILSGVPQPKIVPPAGQGATAVAEIVVLNGVVSMRANPAQLKWLMGMHGCSLYLAPAHGERQSCQHEAYEGRCVHCNVEFVNGRALAAPAKQPEGGEDWPAKVRHLVDVYFAPWGAGKGAEWDGLTGDRDFSGERAMQVIRQYIAESGRVEALPAAAVPEGK